MLRVHFFFVKTTNAIGVVLNRSTGPTEFD